MTCMSYLNKTNHDTYTVFKIKNHDTQTLIQTISYHQKIMIDYQI